MKTTPSLLCPSSAYRNSVMGCEGLDFAVTGVALGVLDTKNGVVRNSGFIGNLAESSDVLREARPNL